MVPVLGSICLRALKLHISETVLQNVGENGRWIYMNLYYRSLKIKYQIMILSNPITNFSTYA